MEKGGVIPWALDEEGVLVESDAGTAEELCGDLGQGFGMDEGLEVGMPAPEVEDLEERSDVLFVCICMCMCICL